MQGSVPYGGSLLELEEDGPHAAHVFGVLAVLGVEVAHPAHSLPLCARHVLITLLNKCSLRLSVCVWNREREREREHRTHKEEIGNVHVHYIMFWRGGELTDTQYIV